MSATRWAILAAICVLAGIFGYSSGKPDKAPDAETATSRSLAGEERQPQERKLADLARPNELSELPESIVTAVEKALAQLDGDPFAAFESLLAFENESDYAQAMMTLVGQMDAAQLGILITGFAAADEDDPRGELLEKLFRSPFAPVAIFERWAQLDPDAVVAFVQTPFGANKVRRNPMEMPFVLRALSLAFVAQRDPEKAFDAADTLRNHLSTLEGAGPEAGMMVDMLMGIGMAISDPVASLRTLRERGASLEAIREADPIFEMAGPRGAEMLSEILQLPEGNERHKILEELYQSWGAYDLSIAIASIDELPDGTDKTRLLDISMRGAISRDPGSALEYLGLLPEGDSRKNLTQHLVERWSAGAPVEALSWARENIDDPAFVSHLSQAATYLPVEEAKAFVAGLSDEARTRLFDGAEALPADHFALRMIREDPRGGLAWLEENGAQNLVGGDMIASLLIEDSLDAAMDFAGQVPEKLSENYVLAVAAEAGRRPDPQSIAWARDHGTRAHETAVAAWAQEEPQAAVAYAAAQDRSLESIAVAAWAGENPAAAFSWMLESHAADPEAMAMVLEESSLIGQWGERQPATAVAAISGFPEKIAAPYVGQVIASWAKEEPARASEYVAQNFPDNGIVRDQAVAALVKQISGASPQEARVWAESISDAVLRAQAIESLLPSE